MKVLGLDPGSRHFGWGVVAREGTRLVHVDHGVIDMAEGASLSARLVGIEAGLRAVVERHEPTSVSMETLIFAKDVHAAVMLGHARGVALLVCARAALDAHEYAPTLVKRAVTGTGRADKTQVAQMIRAFFNLASPPRSDAADALALALTHLQRQPLEEARARAEARMALAQATLAQALGARKTPRPRSTSPLARHIRRAKTV